MIENIIVDENSRLLFAGDWHGDSNAVENALRFAKKTDAKAIIQLGDFGLWPGKRGALYLKKVKLLAEAYQIPILWIDGNHEDFKQLNSKSINPLTGLREYSRYLFQLPRNFQWEWVGLKFRALGGASSLDRIYRVEGVDWWPEELITQDELSKTISMGPCDLLLTHDCPDGSVIPGIDRLSSLRYWPESELKIAWAHREALRKAVDIVKPKIVLHGHFHIRYDYTLIEKDDAVYNFHGLADNNSGTGGNLLLRTISELINECRQVEQLRVDNQTL